MNAQQKNSFHISSDSTNKSVIGKHNLKVTAMLQFDCLKKFSTIYKSFANECYLRINYILKG